MPAQYGSDSGLTLTQVTKIGRNTVKFGGIGLVVAVVCWTLLTSFVAYWQATHPAPPPPPTMGFGYLPSLMFPVQSASDKPQKYTLETATGKLPQFGDRAEVYFMPKKSASLLDNETTGRIAQALGFMGESDSIDSRTYRYTKSEPLVATLTIDTRDHVLEIKTDYLNRPELLLLDDFPTQYEAVNVVKSFLDGAKLIERDVATSSGSVKFVKAVGSELLPAVAVADADFLVVDINRTPIAGTYPIYTELDDQGSIRAILSGAKDKSRQIVYLRYSYFPIMPGQVETYPLRDIRDAWNTVQAGESFILNKGENDTAVIREVVLGYYDSIKPQDYLQPVYVFLGDRGFKALVPALDPTITASNQQPVTTPTPVQSSGVQ